MKTPEYIKEMMKNTDRIEKLEAENKSLKDTLSIIESNRMIGLHFIGKLELYKFIELINENAKMEKFIIAKNLYTEFKTKEID